MKMFKKKDGFTLVELIVVIAILAILAGVAIPAYSGYIKKANDSAVETELAAISSAAMAANATQGEISQITVSADGKTITVTAGTEGFDGKFEANFAQYYEITNKDADNDGVLTVETAVVDFSNTSYKDKGVKWTADDGWVVGP